MPPPFSSFAVQRANNLLRPPATLSQDGADCPGVLALARVCGRLVEVSEAASFGALSALCPLLEEVQAKGELVAWVESGASVFFPPDLQARGLDVEAIPVVWAPNTKAALQAADWLLRSGAFALVVLDGTTGTVDESVLGRLARLAAEHEATILFLTRKSPLDASLGALVSLRISVCKSLQGTELRVVKDKRSGPLSVQRISLDGPLGLY